MCCLLDFLSAPARIYLWREGGAGESRRADGGGELMRQHRLSTDVKRHPKPPSAAPTATQLTSCAAASPICSATGASGNGAFALGACARRHGARRMSTRARVSAPPPSGSVSVLQYMKPPKRQLRRRDPPARLRAHKRSERAATARSRSAPARDGTERAG